MVIKFTKCEVHETDVAVGYKCNLCDHQESEKERITSNLKYAQNFIDKDLSDHKNGDAHYDARFQTAIALIKDAHERLKDIRKSRLPKKECGP